MRVPEALTDRVPALEALEERWEPIPRWALWTWAAFYALFLYQAGRGLELPRLMEGVFVPIHEGGHVVFHIFGEFIGIAGGTLMQLLAPFLLASYFFFRRKPQGVAFCMFFLFEQFLPIATYIADARAQELPLLSLGSGEDVTHDWNYLFGHLGLLPYDTQIAGFTRFAGWLGMIGVVVWLVWRGLTDVPESKVSAVR